MRSFIFWSIIVIVFVGNPSFTQTESIVIKGRVTGAWQGHSVNLYNNITGDRMTTLIENGEFYMEVPYAYPTRYMFNTSYDKQIKKRYKPFGILVEEPS